MRPNAHRFHSLSFPSLYHTYISHPFPLLSFPFHPSLSPLPRESSIPLPSTPALNPFSHPLPSTPSPNSNKQTRSKDPDTKPKPIQITLEDKKRMGIPLYTISRLRSRSRTRKNNLNLGLPLYLPRLAPIPIPIPILHPPILSRPQALLPLDSLYMKSCTKGEPIKSGRSRNQKSNREQNEKDGEKIPITALNNRSQILKKRFRFLHPRYPVCPIQSIRSCNSSVYPPIPSQSSRDFASYSFTSPVMFLPHYSHINQASIYQTY